MYCLLVIFLIVTTTFLTKKSTFTKGSICLAHILRVPSFIMVGGRTAGGEASMQCGHIASTGEAEKEDCWVPVVYLQP